MIECSPVSVIDDDESVRESLPDLLRQFGFTIRAVSSAEAFLESHVVDRTRCLVLSRINETSRSRRALILAPSFYTACARRS